MQLSTISLPCLALSSLIGPAIAITDPMRPPPTRTSGVQNWEEEFSKSFHEMDDSTGSYGDQRVDYEDMFSKGDGDLNNILDDFQMDSTRTASVDTASTSHRTGDTYEESSTSYYSSPSSQHMARNAMGDEKHILYDAYNQLHTLAQEYNKPFDSPAVVVVGHQSSGKSALIEALMGFQFNQVGGGTKTRRPVALRMQYNPQCIQPRWYMVGDDGVEKSATLAQIQDYIQRENERLELDPMRSFDSREINVRMEYKNCPNMILIDTPGLISAPRVSKGMPNSAVIEQQRALQASAREAEKLVVEKMKCEDYLILCVEDTNDWKHGQTRDVVLKADPDLSRTVIVNTKFDTKLPQFGSPSDVADFIQASILEKVSPNKLGGPFFTSVPSGRVGRSYSSGGGLDFMYDDDDSFYDACMSAESSDQSAIIQRLRRINRDGDAATLKKRVGISCLRDFLEKKVEENYKRNVRKILPMLQTEYIAANRKLQSCEKELKSLSLDTLKKGVDAWCDDFCKCLRKALQGTIVAPLEVYGETLNQEYASAGSFHVVQGSPMAVSEKTWDRMVETEVGNKNHRLYGGSQYHRCLREFHLATTCLRIPSITEDEIANAAGLGESHDGVNFLHAACVIAIEKAHHSFAPMVNALQQRMTHVMDRLCPIAEYMVSEKRAREGNMAMEITDEEASIDLLCDHALDISSNPQFRKLIETIYRRFVRSNAKSAMMRCRDDLASITKYVTWNLNERGSEAVGQSLPDQTDMISVYRVALDSTGEKEEEEEDESKNNKKNKKKQKRGKKEMIKTVDVKPIRPIQNARKSANAEYKALLRAMEQTFVQRDEAKTNVVVGALVNHIVTGWRTQFCSAVVAKFNCYFMMPFVDEFNLYARSELATMYEDESDFFDIHAARRNLERTRDELRNECNANRELQEKFRKYSQMMSNI